MNADTMISIKLESDGDKGWWFTITAPAALDKDDWGNVTPSNIVDVIPEGPQATATFYAPGHGGLWDEDGYAGRQLEGTCQFSLSANRKKAYNQLRRMVLRGELVSYATWK
jgi:hypothetical protein